MPNRQHVVTYGISSVAIATIAVAALLQPWRGEPEAPVAQSPLVPTMAVSHAVDVVFAVDTTGSMGGLLESAKRTVWSIATHIRTTDAGADLRIGLVAYRDIGDAYVTRDFALSSDLDAVFTELSGYRAEGGGDTPEDVAAGLYDAIYKMQWRSDARRLVFLVGDAPPADRGDVPSYKVLARDAGNLQIALNTIRCGFDPDTARAWQEIAALGNGRFSTIEQNGGVQQVATPYDAELAAASARIDDTAVIVGGDADRMTYARNLSAASAAPAPAKADRAAYYGTLGAAAPRAKNDLVGNVENGTTAVEAVPAEALPADLRNLDKPALKVEIGKRIEQRKAAEADLSRLNKQRDEYLRAHAAGAGSAAFDTHVNAAIDAELK